MPKIVLCQRKWFIKPEPSTLKLLPSSSAIIRCGQLLIGECWDCCFCYLFATKKQKTSTISRINQLEQVTGIEPAWSAWKADVLPLNYTCKSLADHTRFELVIFSVTGRHVGPLHQWSKRKRYYLKAKPFLQAFARKSFSFLKRRRKRPPKRPFENVFSLNNFER